MLTPIKVFSSNDINQLNEDIWRSIYTKGNDLHFGGTGEVKDAREVFAVIQLYGKALQDLYEGKLPNGWKFGEAANKVYIEMLKNPDKGDQPYTYGERLHNKKVTKSLAEELSQRGFKVDVRVPKEDQAYIELEINQIEEHREMLKEAIEYGIQSNRIWGDIGKSTDLKLKDPPCFRSWQLRTSEGNKVSLRVTFRSNDAINAVFANMCAVIRVFVDEVINPAGGELEEVIWTATSEHMYLNDIDTVEALIGKVPDNLRRLMK